MKNKPRILITNDDGIYAPGIRYLWKSLSSFADITIVAPSIEQSAAGLSITLRQPLRLQKADWPDNVNAWHVSGTPADCVKMAMNVVLDNPPDLIVSGINRGSNAGRNVLYSGTVAGVIEGIIQGVPGIAFSCYDYFNPDFIAAEKYVPSIVQHVLEHSLPKGTLLNVNFPNCEKINGIKLTRQGKQYWKEDPDKRLHPAEGHSYYWLGAKLAHFDEHEDTDIQWLSKGYIAAVPVHVEELTDHHHIKEHRQCFESISFG